MQHTGWVDVPEILESKSTRFSLPSGGYTLPLVLKTTQGERVFQLSEKNAQQLIAALQEALHGETIEP